MNSSVFSFAALCCNSFSYHSQTYDTLKLNYTSRPSNFISLTGRTSKLEQRFPCQSRNPLPTISSPLEHYFKRWAHKSLQIAIRVIIDNWYWMFAYLQNSHACRLIDDDWPHCSSSSSNFEYSIEL